VSLSFPADMSVASAQMMASFVKLLLDQTERQAKAREEEGHFTAGGRWGETLKDDGAAN
jgi:hypothetical protein